MTTLTPLCLEDLNAEFEAIGEAISELEDRLRETTPPLSLEVTLPSSMALTRRMLSAFGRYRGKVIPVAEDADLLAVFKAFVKADPSLNTVRDNVRELVYYKNCIEMDRRDALPEAAHCAAVRTVRHIHLYLCTRLIQAERHTTSL